MFMLALVIAGLSAVIYLVLGLVFDTHQDDGPWGVVTVAVLGFFGILFIDWFGIWRNSPPMYFGNWFWFITFSLVVFLVLTAIKNGLAHSGSYSSYSNDKAVINGSVIVLAVLLVFWMIFGFAMHTGRPWGGQAYSLAKIAQIHREPVGAYPPTDTEHISLVPEQAAQYRANQALTQAQGKYANLSTQYDVGDGTEQSVQNHLYWVFDLRINGWRNANRVGRIVPGYVVVDAEDPDASPQLKLGYKMRYTPGSPTDTSLTRLIWTQYRTYAVDDVTLEVNNDWRPYYTATINKPAYTFGPTIPEKAIVVDPQSGKITDYPFKNVPTWIDRVYSASMVKRLMNWWGNYGGGPNKTPRKFLGIGETSSNRYQVSGDPVLVYSKDGDSSHPEWQVLMTSQRSDSAALFVALFDGRSTNVRLYRVPNLQTDDAVLHAFESTSSNVRKYSATNLALHKIYGRLTWVAEYIPSSGPRSLQAIGMLAADDAGGANVRMGTRKADVLTSYRLWLAGSNDSTNPNPDSKNASITGTVTRVSSVVISGNTTIYLTLDNDPAHVYRGSISEKLPELPFASPGAKVTITYVDVGNATVDIIGYDDAGLELANK